MTVEWYVFPLLMNLWGLLFKVKTSQSCVSSSRQPPFSSGKARPAKRVRPLSFAQIPLSDMNSGARNSIRNYLNLCGGERGQAAQGTGIVGLLPAIKQKMGSHYFYLFKYIYCS